MALRVSTYQTPELTNVLPYMAMGMEVCRMEISYLISWP